MEMGWEVQWYQGKIRLKDHNGDVWQPNLQYGMGLLRPMLEEARMQKLWIQASQHRHGGGMEQGLDLTLTTKHYNWYIKNSKMSQAGAMMAIATGALWPGVRLDQEDAMCKFLFLPEGR
eukprot:10041052-Karenia_brevis.AAC.1